MENGKIRGMYQNFETPEPTDTRFDIFDYVGDITRKPHRQVT